uniref:GH07007p n=1 Tax=Drosophila melanogaster TaxID=7227 RepID=Q95SR1_DROME|nr:GH07007p [Drosophila melanogaster]
MARRWWKLRGLTLCPLPAIVQRWSRSPRWSRSRRKRRAKLGRSFSIAC